MREERGWREEERRTKGGRERGGRRDGEGMREQKYKEGSDIHGF